MSGNREAGSARHAVLLVEDEVMMDKVVSLGFSHVQGFFIDRPHLLQPADAKVATLFN